MNVFYGQAQALFDVSLDVERHRVTSLIGPSGCGKSTFLRCINRMNDVIDSCRVQGQVLVDEQDIYAPSVDPIALRARIGMVFQKPNPFPKSIFENVAYGLRIHSLARNRDEMRTLVQSALKQAGLHKEVQGRLNESAYALSGGQQQRLCIARAIAVKPEIVLMDEPCSALDPIATARIESLIASLSRNYTIVIVTHSMQQAARVSHRTIFFHLGRVVESGATSQIFTKPMRKQTERYITGRIG